MDIVITCPQFDVNKLNIESDGTSFGNECITHMMTKLLDNGYYVGNDGQEQIPLEWISSQVFEKFLDSKIKEDGRNKIKVDYNFLIDPSIRDVDLHGINDRNEKLLFSSGMKSLENIINNDRLRNLITHPVLSTFINLKTKKFQLIVNTNFYIFLFGYLIPFFQLTTLRVIIQVYTTVFELISEITTIEEGDLAGYYLFILSCLCFLSTIFLTCRETVQLFWICDSKKIYLKNRSNQFQILLISLSWIYMVAVYQHYFMYFKNQQYIVFASALIIIFGTIELLLILPYPSMSIYMTMLQQVAKTFIKFFTIFILVIIAFTFSFCIAFSTSNKDDDTDQTDYDYNEPTVIENLTSLIKSDEYSSSNDLSLKELLKEFQKALGSLKNTDNVFQNFDSPLTSFVKTLQMLAGDNLDPYSLNTKSKLFLYFIFILTSFVLFNLINGLAISDIQLLKQKAEYLTLKKQIRNGAECEGVICKMYNNIRGNKDRLEPEKLGCWGRFIKCLLTFMIKRYPFLHKMDNLCIDLKHKTVEYEINDKQVPILKFHSGKSTAYILQDETLDKFNDIICNRNNEVTDVTQTIETLIAESKQMKINISESNQCQQMEMKSNTKFLNDQINDHNAELKSKLDKQNQELSLLKQMIEKLMTQSDV
ncbi:unnamed protein product [Diamesa serratosioi]